MNMVARITQKSHGGRIPSPALTIVLVENGGKKRRATCYARIPGLINTRVGSSQPILALAHILDD